jgi:hypothetical protein
MSSEARSDLVCVVADLQMEQTLKGLLGRSEALKMRKIRHQIYRFGRDPGCWQRGHEYLRSFVQQFHHALVIFDRKGCGQEGTRLELEADLEQRLKQNGWGERAAAIVIDPMLEIWVFSDSPNVSAALGWSRDSELRAWWVEKEFLAPGELKPRQRNPKEAVDAAMFAVQKPRSGAVYRRIAETVSVNRCQDPAFIKLRETLRLWFPKA